jgi:hypothetical protein
MTDIVQVLAGLGVVTTVLGILKYSFERRCWRRFKRDANDWIGRKVELKALGYVEPIVGEDGTSFQPPALEDEVLTVVVEDMLSDAGFTPAQTQQLLQMSIVIVKGMAADKFLI